MFDAPIGINVLNGGIILALMSVPVIVSIGEDALKAVPDRYREAAEAMASGDFALASDWIKRFGASFQTTR